LLRYFLPQVRHKDGQSVSSVQRTLERVGVFSVLINIALVGMKVALAAVSGSLALTASATDSAVDVFASLAVLVGLVISKRKTRTFPFGLYKVENLVSVVIAILIWVAGYEIAKEALAGSAAPVTVEWWLLIGAGLAVIIPLLWSFYELRVGTEANSPSLKADGRHYQTDVVSSLIVFVAVGASGLGSSLDRVGALLVVPFISWSGWGLLRDGMKVLLDASLDQQTLQQVRDIIESFPGVARADSVVGRNSGRYRFIQADIEVRTSDLEKAHRLSEDLERAIKEGVGNVERVVIHYQPRTKTSVTYGIPLQEPAGAVSDHLGKAPYFALVEVNAKNGRVVRQETIANPYRDVEKQKGLQVARMLVDQGVDVLMVRESLQGKGPSYVLADAEVQTRITESHTLSDVLREIQAEPDTSSASG
jgi:cation diffusion facilitator family transporter